MSTELKRLLQRNRQSFKDFCKREQISSYEDLLSYCKERGFLPHTKEEFEKILSLKDLKSRDTEVKSKSEPKKTTKRKTTRRRASTSKTRKNTKVRSDN
jgi:hypothetical protein